MKNLNCSYDIIKLIFNNKTPFIQKYMYSVTAIYGNKFLCICLKYIMYQQSFKENLQETGNQTRVSGQDEMM